MAPSGAPGELAGTLRTVFERDRIILGYRASSLPFSYLGPQNQSYFNEVVRQAAPLGKDFEYIGSPDSQREKIEFLKSLDVFCLPTVYREPKGLPVLEAWANGLPVVLPAHGAFPELVASTGGGLLVDEQAVLLVQ